MPRNLVVLVLAFSLSLQLVPQAATSTTSVATAPAGLHAFLLRADEPTATSYPRTPSFAWNPVRTPSGHYQFELATSSAFDDASIVFKDTKVQIPAETVARQLPWMTGSPYALWAHVRWISAGGILATPWSAPLGFNLRWADADVPHQLPAPEGLVRWAPIEGATSYEVLYPDLVPVISFQTTTNVADEREFFTFHSNLGIGTIHWRVRAIRDVSGVTQATNGLPAVSYGPWSPVFSTVNPAHAIGKLTPSAVVSDVWGKAGGTNPAHQLTPGFAWIPTKDVVTQGVDPGSPLYRVYIFTDNHCVNRIFTGSVVGSPAFAPRLIGGPMALPADVTTLTEAQDAPPYLTGAGSEGSAFDPTGARIVSGETPGSQVGTLKAKTGATVVNLWSGRYYWTVVPVAAEPPFVSKAAAAAAATTPVTVSAATTGGALTYRDLAVPQDSCEAGSAMTFRTVSRPVVTSAGRPFVSGVSPSGRSVAGASSKPSVYSTPIVAWEPALGATRYQVEISRTLYPWHPAHRIRTPSTSVTLPLSRTDAGTWYYRVRGIDEALPTGAQRMTWSRPVRIAITGDRFTVVG